MMGPKPREGEAHVLRDLFEEDDGAWRCKRCSVEVETAKLHDEPVLFGPCQCKGWTEAEQPDLVEAMRAYPK